MEIAANVCLSASSSSITRKYWSLEAGDATGGQVIAVYLLLCELVALPWNVLVVVTIIKEKLYHQPNAILLLNLIVSDLFILIISAPLKITTGFAGEFILGSSDKERCGRCLLDFFLLIPVFNSSLTVALMSLDRFFYIYSPFKYERSSTRYVAGAAVLVSIAVSIALGFVLVFTPGVALFIKPLLACIVIYNHPLQLVPGLVIAILLTTLVVIIVSNACFSRIVLKNIRAVYSHDEDYNETKNLKWRDRLKRQTKSTLHKKKSRLCYMQFFLILAALISSVPFLLFLFRVYFQILRSSSEVDAIVVTMLHYSQVFVHPIIETCLISDIRRPMWNMLTCGGHFKRKNKDQDSQDLWKTSVHSACIKEGGNCNFFCTALEAAITPRGVVKFSTSSNAGI